MDLIVVKFENAKVTYTEDYRVIVDGFLYPRQLACVNRMIDDYKIQSKMDAGAARSAK